MLKLSTFFLSSWTCDDENKNGSKCEKSCKEGWGFVFESMETFGEYRDPIWGQEVHLPVTLIEKNPNMIGNIECVCQEGTCEWTGTTSACRKLGCLHGPRFYVESSFNLPGIFLFIS